MAVCVGGVRCRLPLLRVAAGFRRGHSPPARGEAQFLRAEPEEYHDRLVSRNDGLLCLLFRRCGTSNRKVVIVV